MTTDGGMLRFTAPHLSERERVAYWRDQVGRQVIRQDIAPLQAGAEFAGDLTLRAMPGLRICQGVTSGVRTWRTREFLSDGNDDIYLWINQSGAACLAQQGREVVLEERQALLGSLAEIGGFMRSAPGEHLSLNIPRAAIEPLVPGVERFLMSPIPQHSLGLRLLTGYIRALQAEGERPADPATQRIIVSHIYDLVAMTIGATGDALEIAGNRGVRAARLRAIKADILDNLTSAGLSAEMVAGRQGISTRYMRMLFECEATSFGQFVLDQRLASAYRMLCNPRFVHRRVSDVAYACGFGDLSYFYQAFRRRFGATPSDARAQAMRNDRA